VAWVAPRAAVHHCGRAPPLFTSTPMLEGASAASPGFHPPSRTYPRPLALAVEAHARGRLLHPHQHDINVGALGAQATPAAIGAATPHQRHRRDMAGHSRDPISRWTQLMHDRTVKVGWGCRAGDPGRWCGAYTRQRFLACLHHRHQTLKPWVVRRAALSKMT
jgi:hypothetical protein